LSWTGIHITHALVLSQVGEFANSRLTNVLAVTAAGFVCLLNGVLLLAIAAKTVPTTLIPLTVSMANGAPDSLARG
jgi:hypothetical protein